MEEVAPEMGHEGWRAGNGIWLCETETKVAFYIIRIVCARHVEYKMRVSSLEGRGRYDSWVQLDLG